MTPIDHNGHDEEARNNLENGRGEAELRRALAAQELEVFYQGFFDLGSYALTGMEALLRWRHPDHGRLHPKDFLPLAEETGLIVAITDWILLEVCQQQVSWLAAGLPTVPVAINVSSTDLHAGGLLPAVRRALHETGLDGRWLELEINETSLSERGFDADDIVHGLHDLGVRVSVDHFGAGPSRHPRGLSVERLKIDPAFIQSVRIGPQGRRSVLFCLEIGQELGASVGAEGVETHEQLECLRELGCDSAQGFLFGHPSPADLFEATLRAGSMPPSVH